jgi:hypothetical protein
MAKNQKLFKGIMAHVVLLCGIGQLCIAQVSAPKEWSLAKEKGGISVYTCKAEGYQIKQTKVETIVDLPIKALVDVLMDFDHHQDWMVNFASSELLNSADSATYIYYVEVGAPWPIMNRDLVIKASWEHISDSLVILSTDKVSGYKEERDKFVRIPMMHGQWRFEKIDNHRTKVTNSAHGDPGGWIPGWIVNIKLVADPIKSLENFIGIARSRMLLE